MKKKDTPIFSFLNNQDGGILLSVMAILVMFTFILLMVTENHFAKRAFLVNTKDFYLARTIEEMSLSEMKALTHKESVVFNYNIGKVAINWNEKAQSYDIKTELDNHYKRSSSQWIQE